MMRSLGDSLVREELRILFPERLLLRFGCELGCNVVVVIVVLLRLTSRLGND